MRIARCAASAATLLHPSELDSDVIPVTVIGQDRIANQRDTNLLPCYAYGQLCSIEELPVMAPSSPSPTIVVVHGIQDRAGSPNESQLCRWGGVHRNGNRER